ncbi:membrane-flanked domain-containing protein [Natrialba chahannaoensis JCM 10990]|uniref:Membrane-flanked domain-containing protein n=1 Tax=Natrialba chahannaoensis JCM 10990 TaxID=1227492 RepID=M0AEA2_9EURY|nr:PH domain-containing protein [Natrialba chahannaoensis]ELY97060.1 membrane-flanked domain-containing protein [Natrialba chahannaoensis JCM 10990]
MAPTMNRLHPLSAVTYALQYGFLWLWIPVVLLLVLAGAFDPISGAWVPFAAPFGFLAGVAYGIAYYYRFGYEITSDTVDVSSGVFARRSREIPYGRIQNVDIRQGVLQRLLNLAIVSIETAGGGASEATLNFVSEAEATRLQREIRRRTAAARERRRAEKKGTTGGVDTDTEAETETETETENEVDDAASDADADTSSAPTDASRQPDSRERRDQHDLWDHPLESGPDPADEPDAEPAAEAGLETDHDRLGPQPVDAVDDDEYDTFDEFDDGDGFDEHADRDDRNEFDEFGHPQKQPLFDLQARELLLYSFTSIRAAAVAGVLFVFFLGTDLVFDYLLTVAQPVGGPEDLGTGTPTNYGILTIVSLLNGIVITYVLSVAYTFATYYDFRLGRVDEDFVYERGLLQRYSGSIPAEKVQSVTVTDNPLQRLIGYAGLWVETAGYGPESNGGSQSAVPLAEKARVYTFTENLTGVETPKFEQLPKLARRRYLARYSIIAGVIVAIAFGITQVTVLERWYLAAIVFAAVPPAAHLRYVNLGYYVGEDHLVVRRGFWKRQTTVIPYYRIQTVSTRRSIFQRRLGLASLVIDTASSRTMVRGTPTIYDEELGDARDVHGECRERLQTALRKRAESDDLGVSVDFT